MTVTAQQVADLRKGDVVELTSLEGSTVRGTLATYGIEKGLTLGGGLAVRRGDGEPTYLWTEKGWTLTVVSRAPRPLYVNHPRIEPVHGDVVRIEFVDADDADNYTDVYEPTTNPNRPWMDPRDGSRYTSEQALPSAPTQGVVRLLVDGETGQVVQ